VLTDRNISLIDLSRAPLKLNSNGRYDNEEILSTITSELVSTASEAPQYSYSVLLGLRTPSGHLTNYMPPVTVDANEQVEFITAYCIDYDEAAVNETELGKLNNFYSLLRTIIAKHIEPVFP